MKKGNEARLFSLIKEGTLRYQRTTYCEMAVMI